MLTVLGFTIVMLSSSFVFYHYYWGPKVTYAKWTRKTNPKFPSPAKVRDEIVQTAKGIYTATLCPAAAIYLSQQSTLSKTLGTLSKAYCSENPFTDEEHGGTKGVIIQFLLIVIISDFWEWGYHRLGHIYPFFWAQHKHHHVFFNPSPFAVIADEYVDQFFRALPLFLFPAICPINMDVMFFTYGVFFYVYGIYLHWGYEFDFLDAHNPIINTSYHHYLHHAKAILGKPYHTGFFFKCWDQMTGAVYPVEKCFCVKCERAKGKRTLAQFKAVDIPDYSVLLTLDFWTGKGAFSGTTAGDTNEALTEEQKFFASKGAVKTD
ncbi:hypothetical protein TrCOL_g6634 [Triparma columacea]|uniref:Fatty acid hydroxylase domain-containing protein n=1 Tax=Triparma columacea TaxID=722753 RepID=A0A9W7FYQ2_9STRA|nr:hypothetical protein TrCOL_g6634 [Triparma columacea]